MTSEVTEGLVRHPHGPHLPARGAAGRRTPRASSSGCSGCGSSRTAGRRGSAPLMEVLIGLAVAILLFVVGLRIRAGTITIADFTGLLTGLGVIAGPARRLGGNFATVQQGAAALDRVFMLFDAENTIVDGPDAIERALGQDPLRGRALRLSRRPRRARGRHARDRARPARRLRRPLRAPASRRSSTCCRGSTTRPAGRILLDGHDLRSLTLASLRDQIAVVSQESVLLSGHRRAQHRLRPPRRDAAPRSRRPPAPPPPTASSARCRRATTPRSCRPPASSPAASASGCRSPAPSCATRRSCCSTSRPRRSTPRARR